MEVITMESDAYKRLVNKIEQIADFVAEAKLPSEEKKEAWLDSNQLADALGISTRTTAQGRQSYQLLDASGTVHVQALGSGALSGRTDYPVQAGESGRISQELPKQNGT